MSKTGSAELYELIQSLSRTEKRYLKVNLKKFGKVKEKYLMLFDAIEKQVDYDEIKLKDFEHLPVMKVRLEEMIMENLREFHAQKSVVEKLKSDVRSVELLFDKGLLEHAKKQIQRSKKTAEEYEEFLILYDLLKWELRILKLESYGKANAKEVEQLYNECEECLQKVININSYALYSDKVYYQIRKSGFFRNEKEFKKFSGFMKDKLMRSESNALSSDAKYFYHSTQIGYAELQADYKKAAQHNRAVLKMLEDDPKMIEKQPWQYVYMLLNLFVWEYHTRNYETSLGVANKAKDFVIDRRNSISENLFSRTLYYANTMIILGHNRQGLFEESRELVGEFKAEFKKFKIKPVNKETEWMFNDACALAYFGSGHFSESIHHLNNIISGPAAHQRKDLQSMARIFLLIVHFEMGNQELLRYMVKWTYRFLIRHERLYKFEEIMLRFMRTTMQHLHTRKQQAEGFSALKKEMETLLPDKFQRRPLDDFEFIEWLESKITGVPFAEVVRKKYEVK